MPAPASLRSDVIAMWQAGLNAVRSDRLVRSHVVIEGGELWLGQQAIELERIRRIAVVGAGKAGAGMVAGVEDALAPIAQAKQLHGLVNVPDNCLKPTRWIALHAARPAGVNEPTPAGVEGAQRILRLVRDLTADDLCICLISGGGSALLPAPAPGITLDDKLAVTRFLSAAGANIEELNTVRKQLSAIKGGKLAAACRAGWLVTLIISDVLGDPLDIIASGPTVPDRSTPEMALEVLRAYGYDRQAESHRIIQFLESQCRRKNRPPDPPPAKQWPMVIGNNATAVDAAGLEADRLGYQPAMVCARSSEGLVESVAEHLASLAVRMAETQRPNCLVSGGEPVVRLAPPEQRGTGGRNQQLVLAAYQHLRGQFGDEHPLWQQLAFLSAGTDGEDGPTDAAGAFFDAAVVARIRELGLVPENYLQRNDAYPFFQQAGGLLITGPTHTNVCDVRVIAVSRPVFT